MAERHILSVDTSYDEWLRFFTMARWSLYDDMAANAHRYEITRLGEARANRANLLDACVRRRDGDPARPHFDALVVCSHGEAGRVADDTDSPDETLFSAEDDRLGDIAGGRAVYLFACKTADSDLPERLIDGGATLFVGFREEPRWISQEGADVWRQLDLVLVQYMVLGRGRPAFERKRDDILEEIEENRLPVARRYEDMPLVRDLEHMMVAVDTMDIRSSAG